MMQSNGTGYGHSSGPKEKEKCPSVRLVGWVWCISGIELSVWRHYAGCASMRIQMSTLCYIIRYGNCFWPLNLTDHPDELDP